MFSAGKKVCYRRERGKKKKPLPELWEERQYVRLGNVLLQTGAGGRERKKKENWPSGRMAKPTQRDGSL